MRRQETHISLSKVFQSHPQTTARQKASSVWGFFIFQMGKAAGVAGWSRTRHHLLRRAVNCLGERPVPKLHLADACLQNHALSEAERLVAEAKQVFIPPYAEGKFHFVTGKLLDAQGRYAKAHHHYVAALQWAQSRNKRRMIVAIRLAIAENRLKSGMLHKAIRMARKVLQTSPSNKQANHTIASALLVLGEHERVDRDFSKFLRRYRRNPEILLLRARVDYACGRMDQALEHTHRVLRRDRQNHLAYLLKAMILHDEGNLTEALTAAGRAVQIDESDSSAQFFLANLYNKLGFSKSAIESFERILELNTTEPAAHEFLAYLYFKQGNDDRAEQTIRKGLNIAPNRGSLHSLLGTVLLKKGKPDQASRHFLLALESPSQQTPLNHFRLATALKQIAHYTEAEKHYRKAISMDKFNHDYWDGLISVLKAGGKGAEVEATRILRRDQVFNPANRLKSN